jgi:predicted DNA-binding ribbon-helix-helix protein
MKAKRKVAGKKRMKRATLSFRAAVYETLEKIAEEKKVSLAWVVREAVDGYIGEKWPLFKGQE